MKIFVNVSSDWEKIEYFSGCFKGLGTITSNKNLFVNFKAPSDLEKKYLVIRSTFWDKSWNEKKMNIFFSTIFGTAKCPQKIFMQYFMTLLKISEIWIGNM